LARSPKWPTALRLARAKGGTEVYIPAKLTPRHWLIETVGEEAARKICAHYVSGVHLMLPLGPTGQIALFKQSMLAADRMIAEGQPASKIARATGFTVRSIRRRKARQKKVARSS